MFENIDPLWAGLAVYTAIVVCFGVFMYVRDRRTLSKSTDLSPTTIEGNQADKPWSQRQRQLLGMHMAGANAKCSRGFSIRSGSTRTGH